MRAPAPSLAVLVAMSTVGVGCGGGGRATSTTTTTRTTAAGAPAPTLTPASCPHQLTGFRCATLSVPLHRRGPHVRDGRRLTLAVAVQRGSRPPRGDVVLLTGGPGQPGRRFGPRILQRLGDALDGYRLVVLDQRGTGAGALECPALQRAAGTSDLIVPSRTAVRGCARGLGTQRDAFATADTVADLDALRAALGDRRWVLGGVSYGSFVAERYALQHPGRVRGLILDSVVPQEGAELLERVPMRASARVLRTVCRATAATCAGDPADDLRVVLAREPGLGPGLLDTLTALSIGEPRLDRIPALLHRARAGDAHPLWSLVRRVGQAQHAPAELLSQGLHAATLCADSPAPWGGPDAGEATRARAVERIRATLPAADTAPFPPQTAVRQGLLLTCRWWPPVAAPPPPPAGPIRAPTLLLSGDHDLSTPLEWARAQARRMPHARLVVATGAGHSVLSRERENHGRRALRAFLRSLR